MIKLDGNTKTMDENTWKETLVAEQLTLSLLGKLWFVYPEVEFISSLAAEGVFEEIPLRGEQPEKQVGLSVLQAWARQNQNGLSSEAFEAICGDYTRMFIGPGKVKAPPWESVYYNDSRTIFDEQTLKVREWYRRFGMESVNIYKEPDDHLGLELNFLAYLAGEAVRAIESGDQAEFERLVEAQRQFASAHLFTWFGGWYKLVEQHARTDFYRGLAQVTRGVLIEVSDLLGI